MVVNGHTISEVIGKKAIIESFNPSDGHKRDGLKILGEEVTIHDNGWISTKEGIDYCLLYGFTVKLINDDND
jgi:hypothetical protein